MRPLLGRPQLVEWQHQLAGIDTRLATIARQVPLSVPERVVWLAQLNLWLDRRLDWMGVRDRTPGAVGT